MTDPAPLREAAKGAFAGIARELAAADGDQPALFAMPVADKDGRVAEARERSLKGGRPKGAQNIASRELRDWLLRGMGGKTPQEQLATWSNLGPEGLAVALGCTKLEAFDRWRGVLEYLGKFFMAPIAAETSDGKPVPQMVVMVGGSAGVVDQASGETLPPWEYLDQPDQALTLDGDAPSKDGETTT